MCGQNGQVWRSTNKITRMGDAGLTTKCSSWVDKRNYISDDAAESTEPQEKWHKF